MAKSYDAIIIGAGVIGAATAFEMTKAGMKTLSVDMAPAAGYGSTSNSCAIIRVHYSTFDGTAFAWEGYHYWKDWAAYLGVEDERGLCRFVECGCVVMKTEHNDHLARHASLCEQLSIPHEHWNEAQIVEKLPIYEMSSYWPPRRMEDDKFATSNGKRISGAVWFPTAGYINDPQLSAHNLQVAAEAKGAEFLFQRRVVEVTRGDGRVSGVRLDDGTEISAPVVVNVAGPHSGKVNEMAGVTGDMNMTTKALRQEVVHVPSPDGFDFEHQGTVVSDSDISCYSRPETGNHILFGSEDPDCDGHQFVDPDDFNRDFTDQWRTQALRAGQRVPTLGIPNRMRGAVDLYDVTEDWIPIYDKSNLPGYYMACGSSGNQFKNAPVAGAMMAALVKYCEDGNDHDTDPLQFNMSYTGLDMDVGFYSRKREINQDSSFSVLG